MDSVNMRVQNLCSYIPHLLCYLYLCWYVTINFCLLYVLPVMELIEGDFMDIQFHDWHKADLVFINASCFGDEMLTDLMKLSSKLL